MAKIVIDCGEGVTVDELLHQIEKRGCDLTYFHDAQRRIESGEAKSQREASRQIAEETGEHPAAVETKIRRGKEKVRQVDAPAQEPEKAESEYKWSGPQISEIKDGLPPEYQELKRVGKALGRDELPTFSMGSEYECLQGVEQITRHFMTIAYAKGDIPEEIKEWFAQNKRERSEENMCWRCSESKARKQAPCIKCAELIKQVKRDLEIEARGICPKAKETWQGIYKNLQRLYEEVEKAPGDDPPPRISEDDAQELIHMGQMLNRILNDVLHQVAYQDVFT